MAASNFTFYRGDDIVLEYTLLGSAGTDYFEIKFSIKQNIDDTEILFQASKQNATLTYDMTTGKVTVPIPSDTTKEFCGKYVYDIQTNASNDTEITTHIKSVIEFIKDVTTN